MASSAAWIRIQRATFTNWANYILQERGIILADIITDMKNGVPLCHLVEVLTGIDVLHYAEPVDREEQEYNIQSALTILRKMKGLFFNVRPIDIQRGYVPATLSLTWMLILKYKLEHRWDSRDELLTWVNSFIGGSPYNLHTTNFTTEWNNGRRMLALVSVFASLEGTSIYESLVHDDAMSNAETAIGIAEEELDVPALISPEDLVIPQTDELSVITYLSLFREIIGKASAQEQKRESMEWDSLPMTAADARQTAMLTTDLSSTQRKMSVSLNMPRDLSESDSEPEFDTSWMPAGNIELDTSGIAPLIDASMIVEDSSRTPIHGELARGTVASLSPIPPMMARQESSTVIAMDEVNSTSEEDDSSESEDDLSTADAAQSIASTMFTTVDMGSTANGYYGNPEESDAGNDSQFIRLPRAASRAVLPRVNQKPSEPRMVLPTPSPPPRSPSPPPPPPPPAPPVPQVNGLQIRVLSGPDSSVEHDSAKRGLRRGISYMPTNPKNGGVYQIEVLWQGVPIEGSPFTVDSSQESIGETLTLKRGQSMFQFPEN
eukprot:m.51562 g.51562  ORF g.51562 m.51562 type:complete len:548 (+) comp11245_c0_seq1:285-1928(+)